MREPVQGERNTRQCSVAWLDAHGDLNTPEESSSSLFYGMPLRSVMDASCFGLLETCLPLKPKQIIHIGREDLIGILEACKDKLVGMGIYEYVRVGKKLPLIEELIQYGLSL